MPNPRSSYTIQNASRFRPAFDKAIETQSHVEVPVRSSGMQMLTLKQRMSDALLYLANEIPDDFKHDINNCPDCKIKGEWCGKGERYTAIDYLKLKAQTRMRCCEANDSIIIYFFKKNPLPSLGFKVLQVGNIESTPAWRQKLVEWLEGKNSQPVLLIPRLTLSPEDMIWAKEMFGGTGIEHEVRMDSIKAVRNI